MRTSYENFSRLYVHYKEVTTTRGDDELIKATVSFIDGCAHLRNRFFRGAVEERTDIQYDCCKTVSSEWSYHINETKTSTRSGRVGCGASLCIQLRDSLHCRELSNKLSQLMLRTPETLLQLVAKI